MSDLVKRLRSGYVSSGLMKEAAARIESLEAENKRLREALENIAQDCEADYPPSHGAIKYAARAAAAMEKK